MKSHCSFRLVPAVLMCALMVFAIGCGPEKAAFDTLQDWTTRPEPGIRRNRRNGPAR